MTSELRKRAAETARKFAVEIPEGESGDYKIQKFTISKTQAELENLRASIGRGRGILPGKYTKLVRGGTLVMSDTPAEIQDHLTFIRRAEGKVLINGLGIGMCLKAILDKPEVQEVTVIEISKDVIKLVGPSYKDERLEIVNASAFDYKPPQGSRYQSVWHDIWDHISDDNLPEMAKLHRKYGSKTDWQGSWCKEACVDLRRQNKRHTGYYF